MTWAERLTGPHSKYDNCLPCTYEARVSVMEWDEAYNSYYSDTICGLIDFLKQKNISPEQVSLYEIYRDHESAVETCLCLDEHDLWLSRPNLCRPRLCRSLHDLYKGHIENGHCSFQDRRRLAPRR